MRRETFFGGLKNSSDIRNAADFTQKYLFQFIQQFQHGEELSLCLFAHLFIPCFKKVSQLDFVDL